MGGSFYLQSKVSNGYGQKYSHFKTHLFVCFLCLSDESALKMQLRHHFPLLLCCTGGASQGASRGGIIYSEWKSRKAEDTRNMKYEMITAPSLSFPSLCKLCPNKSIFPFFKKNPDFVTFFFKFHQVRALFLLGMLEALCKMTQVGG